MVYATIYEPRQILGVIILATPMTLMAWGWLRLVFRRPSDPPIAAWILSVVFLALMTVGYVLTLAQIFNAKLERYFFNLWHTGDMFVDMLISFLTCLFAWKGKGPIRWQVFIAGVFLTVFYLAAGWSLME